MPGSGRVVRRKRSSSAESAHVRIVASLCEVRSQTSDEVRRAAPRSRKPFKLRAPGDPCARSTRVGSGHVDKRTAPIGEIPRGGLSLDDAADLTWSAREGRPLPSDGGDLRARRAEISCVHLMVDTWSVLIGPEEGLPRRCARKFGEECVVDHRLRGRGVCGGAGAWSVG